jgi:hypothetical protein
MWRFFIRLLGLGALAAFCATLAPAAQAGPLTGKDLKTRPTHKEKHTMAITPSPTKHIPPIDAAQPAQFETATFALG